MKGKIVKLCSRMIQIMTQQIVKESTILHFKSRRWASRRNLGVGLDNIYKNNLTMNELNKLLKGVGR